MSFIQRNINFVLNVPPYKFFIQHHYIIIIYMATKREFFYNILVEVGIGIHYFLEILYPMMKSTLEACLE